MLVEFETTLRSHDELNPRLWIGDKLRPEVREKLTAFAETFGRHSKIPPALVQDVLMVGGSAGYNWTQFSDIDVHLLVDKRELGPEELVNDFLQSKKNLWSLTHNVKVRGFPLEGYVQDLTEQSPVGQGVYSIKNGRWIKTPEHDTHSWTTDESFEAKVTTLKAQIDHMVDTGASLADLDELKSRIANMRRAGLSQGGEYNIDNEVFKELRNAGYLQKMTTYARNREDSELSLGEKKDA